MDVSGLPESKRLTQLSRAKEEVSGRGSRKLFLATTPFEDWLPSYIGEGLPASERKEILKARKSEKAPGLAHILEQVGTFWAAHLALEVVTISAVHQHMLLLVRYASEKGVAYAENYERLLHARMLSDIKKGLHFSISRTIATRNPSIERETRERAGPRRGPQSRMGFGSEQFAQSATTRQSALGGRQPRGKGPRWKGSQSGQWGPRNIGQQGSGQAPMSVPQASTGAPSGGSGQQAGGVRLGVGFSKPPNPDKGGPPSGPQIQKDRVCMAHDLATGRQCQLDGCRHQHLDTRNAAQRQQFQEAQSRVRQAQERRQTSSAGGRR